MLRGGLACFMDEMDSKLDTKEKGLAFEMARAMQPAAQLGSLLEGIDLLTQQILELPCTAGGVEFSSSQVRDKLRNKYRDDPKLAEKIKEALATQAFSKSRRTREIGRVVARLPCVGSQLSAKWRPARMPLMSVCA